MSHSTYKMPLHLRVRFLEILLHLIYRFSDTLYIICYSMAAYLVVFKLLVRIIIRSKLENVVNGFENQLQMSLVVNSPFHRSVFYLC